MLQYYCNLPKYEFLNGIKRTVYDRLLLPLRKKERRASLVVVLYQKQSPFNHFLRKYINAKDEITKFREYS